MNDVLSRRAPSAESVLNDALQTIREKAASVRFGTITLTLHEGRLTQLEISEKKRFGG